MSTTKQDLREVFKSSIQISNSSVVKVTSSQVIGVNDLLAIVIITTSEASSLTSSTETTRTIIAKTSDGGITWQESLNTDRGSINTDEIFFVDESHFWMITQWQIAGTFPTFYWTSDFGDTWQKSDTINEFLKSKGHTTVSFAEGVRFRNLNEGIIIARGMANPEDAIYFLATTDGGKTWEEIPEIPSWYFAIKGWNWKSNQSWKIYEKDQDHSTVLKATSDFPKILKDD